MMMFRISSALGGTFMPSAFSTARIEAMEWTVVQTPQNRWVKYQASRGSLVFRIFSIPRNIVLLLQASTILPLLISASILKCPSILVIGSTTIFVMCHVLPLFTFRLLFTAKSTDDSVSGKNRCRSHSQPKADLVRSRFDAKAGHIGESTVKRGQRIPEHRLGAACAAVTGGDRPARLFVVPLGRTVMESLGALAPHFVEAVTLAVGFIAPFLHILSGIKVATSLAVVMNPLAKCEKRSADTVDSRKLLEKEEVHDCRREIVRIQRATGNVQHCGARHGFLDADSSGRIRSCCRDSAV